MDSIIETIGGETVEFKPLLVGDYQVFEGVVRANRKASFKAMLDECGLKGVERFAALKNERPDEVYAQDVMNYLRTHDGMNRALSKSLEKAGRSAEQIAKIVPQFDFLDGVNLAHAVFGFQDRTEKGAETSDPLAGQPDSRPSSTTAP